MTRTDQIVDAVAAAIRGAAEANGYQITRGYMTENDCLIYARASADIFAATIARVRAVADELEQTSFLFPNGQQGVARRIRAALDAPDWLDDSCVCAHPGSTHLTPGTECVAVTGKVAIEDDDYCMCSCFRRADS